VCWAFAVVISSLCVACAIVVFDEGCLIFGHGIWSKQVIQVRIIVPRSALRAIRRWPTCVARHFTKRVFVERRRLQVNFEKATVFVGHEVLAHEELSVVVGI
jgi:hypothetical protein